MNTQHKTVKVFFVSFLLLLVALPPLAVPWMLFFALVPLFIFTKHEPSFKKVFLTGWGIGVLYFLIVSYPLLSLERWWWVSEQSVFLWQNKIYIFALIILIASLLSGLSFGITALAYKKYKGSIARFIIPSLIWVACEYIRTFFLLGFFGIGTLGVFLTKDTAFVQIADIISVYGISALIVLINILITESVTTTRYKRIKIAIALALIVLTVYMYGVAQIERYRSIPTQDITIAIAKVPMPTEALTGQRGGELFKETLAAALQQKPDIVVFPENILPDLVIDETIQKSTSSTNNYTLSLFNTLQSKSAMYPETSIILGLHTQSKSNRYNSVVIIKNGKISGIYHKRFLLPLAEYTPKIFSNTFSLVEPLSAGKDDQRLFIAEKEVSFLICAEALKPGLVRKKTLVINIANDAIFKDRAVADYMQRIAKIRAIENRSLLVRSTKRSLPSIITPAGDMIKPKVSASNFLLFEI